MRLARRGAMLAATLGLGVVLAAWLVVLTRTPPVGLLETEARQGSTGVDPDGPPAGIGAVQQATIRQSAADHAVSEEERSSLVDSAWVRQMAGKTGIPEAAMRAYATASLRVGREAPACTIGWSTLAGIGWVESKHGTIGGRSLQIDGRSDRTIVAPALNGRGDYAAISSSPTSAKWHGDAVWDHAVGPMQFIGSTWNAWASDGDGDGESDPTDVDDAAYAAARYLCASGSLEDDNWSTAILSYNHSADYVTGVWTAAKAYAELSLTK